MDVPFDENRIGLIERKPVQGESWGGREGRGWGREGRGWGREGTTLSLPLIEGLRITVI